MKPQLFALLLAGASAASFAAPLAYNVDSTHTFASYRIEHLGFSYQSGTFTQVSGTVVVDKEAHTGSVDISIDANSLQTFYAKRDEHLKSPAFFNVAKFPTITFKSKQLVFQQDQLTSVVGDLTMLGVTKPVTLTVDHFKGGKNDMTGHKEYGANAHTIIKRSDFGMMSYIPYIADEVELDVTIEADRDDK
jgi:polyisoprenoid-binding protein YceI